METFDAIRTVLAVRAYRDAPIPDDIVHEIVEAAHLTASSQNGQPWRFVVVQEKETLRQLAAVLPTGRYVAQAPMAIAVGAVASPFDLSDVSRAIQSMMLAAWSRGVASNWVGWQGRLAAVKPLLGVPDDVELFAVVPFGYPAQPTGAGIKKRKPLGEIAFRERFGQPFA